jgi:DNA invertase Pin-like site-specific DNA recombinase
MCIACEMAFMDMLEALAPEERERILREQFAGYSSGAAPPDAPIRPFVCEPFDEPSQQPEGERKP